VVYKQNAGHMSRISVCLSSLRPLVSSCLNGAAWSMALSRQRDSGPRSQLGISRLSSASAMNFGTAIGTGEEITLVDVLFMLVDVLLCIDAIVELLQSSQPHKALLAARESAIVRHVQRLEFLRFGSISNPLQWVYQCECYFRACWTPDNGGLPTWKQFVFLIAA
jgi:hypothetical protein